MTALSPARRAIEARLSPAELWRYRALDPDFVPRSREAREAMRAELQRVKAEVTAK